MGTPPRALAGHTIIGARVIDTDGTAMGRLEDLVIDAQTGQVRYAVLSFGIFLGIADKLFAVPWDAIRIDPARNGLVLGIRRDQLDGAPGFDKDRWPDMADDIFTHAMRSHYGPRAARSA